MWSEWQNSQTKYCWQTIYRFSQISQKNVRKIRHQAYETEARTCHKVILLDANVPYLWLMMQAMPTHSLVRRKTENNFYPQFTNTYGRMAWSWLEYVAFTSNLTSKHNLNAGECKVGQHALPVYEFWRKAKIPCTNSIDVFPTVILAAWHPERILTRWIENHTRFCSIIWTGKR